MVLLGVVVLWCCYVFARCCYVFARWLLWCCYVVAMALLGGC